MSLGGRHCGKSDPYRFAKQAIWLAIQGQFHDMIYDIRETKGDIDDSEVYNTGGEIPIKIAWRGNG